MRKGIVLLYPNTMLQKLILPYNQVFDAWNNGNKKIPATVWRGFFCG